MFSISHIYVSKLTKALVVFMVWIGASILTFQSWKYVKTVQVISKLHMNTNASFITKTPVLIQEPVKILIVAFPRLVG